MNKNLSQVFYVKMEYFNPDKVVGTKIYLPIESKAKNFETHESNE